MSTPPSLCIPLTGTTMCPDFASLNAYIPPSVASQITDITSFDSLIQASIQTDAASGFGSAVRSTAPGGYGCIGWDGKGLQYIQSTLCAYFVGMGAMNIADGSAGTCNPPGTSVPLCAATAQKFSASWDAVFGDVKNCPNGQDPGAISYKSYIMYSVQGILSTSAGCLVSLGMVDGSHCGFATAAELLTFCAINTTDSCCSDLGSAPGSAFINTTQSPTNNTGSSTSSDTSAGIIPSDLASTTTAAISNNGSQDSAVITSKLPVAAIAAGAGGFLLVIALILFYVCYRKRKNAKNSTARAGAFTPNEFNKMEDNGSYSYAKEKAADQPSFNGSGIHNTQNEIHEAVCNWVPTASDELSIENGDKIVLKLEYNDGWAFGVNRRIGAEGFFPLAVLKQFAGNNNQISMTNTFSIYSKRGSSAYEHNRSLVQKYDSFISVQDNARAMQMKGRAVNATKTVTFKFMPSRKDELELMVNDKVRIEFEYDGEFPSFLNLSELQQNFSF
ncbi:UNVERIFIED_CONTAM: hypothetical protein HDU68_002526 [Siphonaria sp. JEL0065]|nr:hypothetical protein HDU68_002526 [Siphonaria sp. JEL0065]